MEDKQAGNIDSSHDSNVPQKKIRNIPVLLGVLVCMILLLVGGTYAISRTFQLPGEKTVKKISATTPSPTKTTLSSPLGEVPVWTKPTQYVSQKPNGDFVVGNLESGTETIIARSKGKVLGAPLFVSFSVKEKRLFYMQLPDGMIAGFQKNPPYEFYGSTDYELHMVTIEENGTVTDKLIDTKVSSSFLEGRKSYLGSNEAGLYYPKYENNTDVYYYFEIKNGTSSQSTLPEYLKTDGALSPSGNRSLVLETLPKDLSDTQINNTYNLILVEKNGSKSTLYGQYIAGEQSLAFPTETMVFIAREDYHNGPESICYIEQIDVPSKAVTQIQKKDCPPGSSNTDYNFLSISPDGKYLVATYSEDAPGTGGVQKGSVFVYDISARTARSIAEINKWYSTYFWVGKDETLANSDRFGSPTITSINVTTGAKRTISTPESGILLAVF